MSTLEDVINNITGFIDPFHLVISKADPNVRIYKNKVDDYNVVYNDLVKMKGVEWVKARGIKPIALLETAGTSFSLPTPEMPFTELAGADLSRGAGAQAEEKIAELQDNISELQRIANSSAGGGARAPPAGYSPTYSDVPPRNYERIHNPSTGESRSSLASKYGKHLIKSEVLRQLILHLVTDKKGFSADSNLSATERKALIERLWKATGTGSDRDTTFQNRILNIINDHGLYIVGCRQVAISREAFFISDQVKYKLSKNL